MNIIIVNDLRAFPVSVAISIASKLNRADLKILISEEWLDSFDYGQKKACGFLQTKVMLLRLLKRAIIVKTKKDIAVSGDITGMMSSLYSITNDSQATPEKYPELWLELKKVDNGAASVLEYIKSFKVENLYLYNGRTASCYLIAKYASEKSININYYEYGRNYDFNAYNINVQKYTMTHFPIHDLKRWGVDLLSLYEKDDRFKVYGQAMCGHYKKTKLNNQFVASYIEECSREYDVVMFLSSTHEYMSLSSLICEKIGVVDELVFAKKVIAKNGPALKYAVRCHPNQKKDPSWDKTLCDLQAYCKTQGVDFYGPDSGVSSYSLIRKSKIIAVDISSIGVEAIVMGKDVQIYGNPVYKVIYERGCALFGDDREMVGNFVLKVMSLSYIAHQYSISFEGRLWYFLDFYSWRLAAKTKRHVVDAVAKVKDVKKM